MTHFLVGIFYAVALTVANPEIGLSDLRWWVAIAIIAFAEPIVSKIAEMFHA